jgi:hypothetical protein
MRTLNPLRIYRILARRRRIADAAARRRLLAARVRVQSATGSALAAPTVYMDERLARVLAAIERRSASLRARGATAA